MTAKQISRIRELHRKTCRALVTMRAKRLAALNIPAGEELSDEQFLEVFEWSDQLNKSEMAFQRALDRLAGKVEN